MKKLFLTLALLCVGFAKNVVDLNLNETDVEFGLENIKKISASSRLYTSAHFFHGEDEFERMQNLFQGELTASGLTPIPGFSVGLGLKGIFTQVEFPGKDLEVFGLGIKFNLLYTLPIKIKTTLNGFFVYTPQSVSFLDLHDYREWRMQIDVEIIDGAMFYVGYRDMQMEFDTWYSRDDYSMNSDGYLGIKIIF